MDGLGETEVIDGAMDMMTQEKHFQDMNMFSWFPILVMLAVVV